MNLNIHAFSVILNQQTVMCVKIEPVCDDMVISLLFGDFVCVQNKKYFFSISERFGRLNVCSPEQHFLSRINTRLLLFTIF